MSQADFTVPAGQSGLNYRSLDTAGKAAIASSHIGAGAPSYVVTGMVWIDNSANPLWNVKMYDGTDWISMGIFNVSTNYYSPANAILTDSSNIYALTTGSANAYVATLSPAPTAYTAGMMVNLKLNFTCTGAATINLNGLGAKTIKKAGTVTDVVTSDLSNNSIVTLIYDGTNFQVCTPTPLITGKAASTDIQNGATLNNFLAVTPNALGALWIRGSNIVSANALPVSTVGGYYLVSGNTAITSILYTAVGTIVNGQKVSLRFSGTPLLTHNATSFILPGGRSIQVVAGDYAEFLTEDGTNWRCISFQRTGGLDQAFVSKAAGFSINASDYGKEFQVQANGTVTLDTIANFGQGWWCDIKVDDAVSGQVAITANGTDRFRMSTGSQAVLNVSKGSAFRIYVDAGNLLCVGKLCNQVVVGTPTAAAHAAGLTALGWQPKSITAVFTNTTTEGGWGVGDQVVYSVGGDVAATTGTGVMAGIDASTSMNYVIGVNGTKYLVKTTGAIGTLTPANWSLTIYYNN